MSWRKVSREEIVQEAVPGDMDKCISLSLRGAKIEMLTGKDSCEGVDLG